MFKILTPLFLLVFIPNDLLGQIHQMDGQHMNDRLGWSVSGAGDVNGDGIPDFIAGALYADNGLASGSAYVYSGANGTLLYQFDGQNSADRFGESVSAAGDVNGDGFDDLIVGADSSDNGGSSSGSAYIYSGVNGALLYQWDGQKPADRFGGTVSGAGDVNGDGFDDVIVGADGVDNNGGNSGAAFVYSGANAALLYQFDGQNADDHLGRSVSGAGDLNGDGFDDVFIGADGADNNGSNSGSAYVYSGANGTLLYRFDGQNPGDTLGGSVSRAGDVNSDGFEDLIVGAFRSDNNGFESGSAYVYSGANGALLYQWDGENSSDHFGWSVSGAGDVNGNGHDDVIVGANNSSNNSVGSGSAYVYSGAHGSLLYQWDGQSSSDRFGGSVSGAGDVNGDGFDDVIVGADSSDAFRFDSGTAYVYSVSAKYSITPMTAGSPATFTITGAAPNSSVTLGYSLSGAGPFTTVFGVAAMTPPINTLTVLSADANGDASWTVNVPGSVSGSTLYTQGLNAGFLTNALAESIN